MTRKTKAMLERDNLFLERMNDRLIKKTGELLSKYYRMYLKAEQYRIFYEYLIYKDEEKAEIEFRNIKKVIHQE